MQALLDASETMALLKDDAEIWAVATALASRFGAKALNIGAGSLSSGELLWMRSNMNNAWLDDYVSQGFMTLDPFVDGATRLQPVSYRGGVLTRADAGSTAAFELNHQIHEAGYGFCYGTPFAGSHPDDGGMVVLGFDATEADRFSPARRAEVHLLSTVIAAAVPPPVTARAAGMVHLPGTRLTRREREVLLYLSDGHGNEEIARRMGISEATVQKHLRAARERLNAQSREQALAKALRMGLLHR
ncbi:response regulator transcription factor [Jannaschia sp. M317]|uniref:response regulator transcription factor n=1 Tax=Jannaschia sp. M317 TaxID=2867011 RepID=UPI0021A7CEAB|nr:helix-turn-helix transcriptional regulator [Jannaschia sp. M317]UWQ17547.1 helix-turn-helix transcriptional regulator [Jannaschia sp. M317]